VRTILVAALAAFAVLSASVAPAMAAPVRRIPATATPLTAPNFSTPAATLRVELDAALAEHAFLLGEALRAGLGDGAGFDAAGAAIERNTVSLVGMIRDVYGDAASKRFGELWRDHVAYLVDYTRAVKANDAAAQSLAQHQLHTYVRQLTDFLADANPNLPRATVQSMLQEHVAQLEAISQFDAGSFGDAYASLRMTYTHMFDIGDALAEGIAVQFPGRFKGKSLAYSPAGDLRVTLDRLLGEHTVLAISAMRAAMTAEDDDDAANGALASNTNELTEAITDIYGEPAGQAFKALWTQHTDAYLDYVRSTVQGDAAGRTAARDGLRLYQADFSRFMADANPRVSATELQDMLAEHVQQLIDQVDAFGAERFGHAYRISHDAFHHAIMMGDLLALAIASQFPDVFPDARVALGVQPPLAPAGGALLVVLAALLAAIQLGRRGRRRG
jgi:hypothetical protein